MPSCRVHPRMVTEGRPAPSRPARQRRVVQAVLYEVIAVVVVGPVLGWLFDEPMLSALGLAMFMSGMALVWNYVFNGWFERWERRQAIKGRSVLRRSAGAAGAW